MAIGNSKDAVRVDQNGSASCSPDQGTWQLTIPGGSDTTVVVH
jgi:hypothetical protein